MTYAATWTNANAQDRLDAGTHHVRLCDGEELADAVNRRRLLTYQSPQDFSSHLFTLAYVRQPTIAGETAPPFDNLRANLDEKVLDPPAGGMGGDPYTPTAMDWLWPIAGDDENKIIVSGAEGVAEGQVGLFQELNETDHWTDAILAAGSSNIRAVHFNELRQATEWIRRGRWELPIYLAAGLFSPLPDSPWIGELIANNGSQELRTVGFAVIREQQEPYRGLANVIVRASSFIEITADADCTVEVHRVLRPLEFVADQPTWNEYDPSESSAWTAPGALGQGDSTLIGSIVLTAQSPGSLSNAALVEALGAMIDGGEQNFLVRRADTGANTIGVSGRLVIEFDLDNPPN